MRRRTITLRPQALAKGLTLDAEIDAASQDALVGDPTRVRQILLNLLSNAIKFTDQGGVRVHASTIDQPVCADDLESRSAVGGCLSNVAARLEGIAEPGGICISSSAYDQVRGKVEVEFADLGEQRLKNIDRPVRVYTAKSRGHVGMVGPDASSHHDVQKPLPLPDKPSIAVLPFQNMSGDPEQEYFADGMVEDIITALSRFKSLFVIARNSSFAYKGKAVNVKQVGRELGVRYVLEGSVRRAGNRLRITAQLIEAATGSQLWAERFEGSLENIFELQDGVATSVVGAIVPQLMLDSAEQVARRPADDLDSYDRYLRGIAFGYPANTRGQQASAD